MKRITTFVKAKTKLDLELLNERSISDVTVGKENWLFYTVSEDGEDALADYQRTNLYTADEKTALAVAITSVNEKMKERGIRFVMFEAPNKESVYAEYMPDSVRVYGSESRLDAALPELAAQGLPVYDMKPELLKEADTYQLYYKYDTHWNQIGSFIGSQQIAQTLLGTSTSLSAVSIEAAGPASGDLARMLNMAAEYSDDTEYMIQNYLPEVTATTVDMNEDKLGTFLVKLARKSLSEKDSQEVSKMLHTIGDLERLGDHAVNVAEGVEFLKTGVHKSRKIV